MMILFALFTTLGSYTLLLISLSCPVQVEAAVVCPPTAAYTPCNCTESSTNYIELNCGGLGLGDSRMSEILTTFLTTPGLSPIASLYLRNNELTNIPRQIKFFTQATTISLYNNAIPSIESGAFNFTGPEPLFVLDLGPNQLTTIAPGAFKGITAYDKSTQIVLYSNRLTRFESAVFQPLLEKLTPFGGSPNAKVDLTGNRFNCSDHCHLAWLIRDNPQLLAAVGQAKCSNGTTFYALDPKDFARSQR